MDKAELMVIDAVYGKFSLPGYIRSVVETEEFSRLKRLKQLGVSNLVFKGAVHTRNDHSLGACYLADTLLDAIKLNSDQPITASDRMCVTLAAVLHDVGHGPFSHMWEKFVGFYGRHWRHEESSVLLVRQVLERMENVTPKQVDLVCAMIQGRASELLSPDRKFLAQIVSNDVDVDRCDYLQRDSHYVPNIIRPTRPFREMFDRARVVTVNGESVVAYHLEDYPLVYEMANARQKLHRCCYQDPSVLGTELMMLDVLHEAERAGYCFARNGKSAPLSNVHSYPELFKYLDDSIVEELATSQHPGLERTKEIITRLRNGEYYEEIIRSPIDMQEEINHYNEHLGKRIVVQASRYIKSTEQWIRGFNVLFYSIVGGKLNIVPIEKVVAANATKIDQERTIGELGEFIIYCTSADQRMLKNAIQHFMNLRNTAL